MEQYLPVGIYLASQSSGHEIHLHLLKSVLQNHMYRLVTLTALDGSLFEKLLSHYFCLQAEADLHSLEALVRRGKEDIIVRVFVAICLFDYFS